MLYNLLSKLEGHTLVCSTCDIPSLTTVSVADTLWATMADSSFCIVPIDLFTAICEEKLVINLSSNTTLVHRYRVHLLGTMRFFISFLTRWSIFVFTAEESVVESAEMSLSWRCLSRDDFSFNTFSSLCSEDSQGFYKQQQNHNNNYLCEDTLFSGQLF